MDTLHEAAISLLRQALLDDPRSVRAKTTGFRVLDAMANFKSTTTGRFLLRGRRQQHLRELSLVAMQPAVPGKKAE